MTVAIMDLMRGVIVGAEFGDDHPWAEPGRSLVIVSVPEATRISGGNVVVLRVEDYDNLVAKANRQSLSTERIN